MRSRVLAQRVTAHGLTRRVSRPAQVLDRLFALQAQDLVQARWALGARTKQPAEREVDAAFEAGAIVRAWCLRGTLHAVAAQDVPWLISLLGERNLKRVAARHRQLGISSRDVDAAARVVEPALRTGPASREALFARLEDVGQATAEQRGVHLLFSLAQRGLICQLGEAFTLVAALVPAPAIRSGDEAVAHLARKYLQGHGPSTADDFAFWTGLPGTLARRAFELAGPVTWDEDDVPRALLLPGFDEYLLGYRDRSACLEPRFFDRLVPGGNGVFRPMVVLDGHIEGTWRRAVKDDVVTVSVEPFATLKPVHRRALEEEAARFAGFLGRAPRLVVEPA